MFYEWSCQDNVGSYLQQEVTYRRRVQPPATSEAILADTVAHLSLTYGREALREKRDPNARLAIWSLRGNRKRESRRLKQIAVAPESFDSFNPFDFLDSDTFVLRWPSPENSATYGTASLERALPQLAVLAKAMLKITILDAPDRRRFVLEGKLVAPWAAELKRECREAAADLRGRELVIELKNVTCISEDGEDVLLELMKEGVRFRSSGVFTKHVMKQLARKIRRNIQEDKR